MYKKHSHSKGLNQLRAVNISILKWGVNTFELMAVKYHLILFTAFIKILISFYRNV